MKFYDKYIHTLVNLYDAGNSDEADLDSRIGSAIKKCGSQDLDIYANHN